MTSDQKAKLRADGDFSLRDREGQLLQLGFTSTLIQQIQKPHPLSQWLFLCFTHLAINNVEAAGHDK